MVITVQDCQTDDERRVIEFLDLWGKQDIDGMISYFAEGATYMDMPLPPRVGLEEIRGYIERVFDNFGVRIETFNIASRGNVVFTDRIDYLSGNESGIEVPLPIAGIFEMVDGKIAFWRDFLDLRTAEEGLGITIRPSEDSPRIG